MRRRFFLIELAVAWYGYWAWPVEQDLIELSGDGRIIRLAALTIALEGLLALWILGAFRIL